jgi:hypothetical protein
MFKQLTAIFLFAAILAQTFSKAVIVLDFYANQKYIAANLCENKDKPQMNCCGKCQLKKRLNKEDNKDKQMPERKNGKEEVLSSKSFFATVQPAVAYATVNFPDQDIKITIDFSSEFFHPPGA